MDYFITIFPKLDVYAEALCDSYSNIFPLSILMKFRVLVIEIINIVHGHI